MAELQGYIVQRTAMEPDLARLERQLLRHKLAPALFLGTGAIGSPPCAIGPQTTPGIQIKHRQLHPGLQAGSRQSGFRLARLHQLQAAACDAGLSPADIALQQGGGLIAPLHAELIGQRLGHGWHRAVDTQGQGAVGCLSQRSRQHDRHALQVGLQTDFRHAVQHLDLQAITRLALQMPAQSHQFAHLLGVTQALGRGNTVYAHLHRSRGGVGGRLHAALDAHITA
ncbi:hypothetical protein SDC9_144979 [bioreactor metagenome]|uniref:Uncharacterized protein n=1 Tax=bioreactor metagenome TaxID=1076179 RepID=A0A645E7R8_9ZZZZ